jgi:hypothetical protein
MLVRLAEPTGHSKQLLSARERARRVARKAMELPSGSVHQARQRPIIRMVMEATPNGRRGAHASLYCIPGGKFSIPRLSAR